MWNIKRMIIPVIIGATGTVTKGLKKNLEAMPVNIQQIHYKRQLYLEHHT
jgi:adenylosuccinate lyase